MGKTYFFPTTSICGVKPSRVQKDPKYAISLHLSKLGMEYSRSAPPSSSSSFSTTTGGSNPSPRSNSFSFMKSRLFNQRSRGFEYQSIRREQLSVHLRICVAHAPTKPPKNNKYTEDTI